jgi:hypothetical protein
MGDKVTRGRSFGEEHFVAAELGDRRRVGRLVRAADQMIKHPGGTLPEKLPDPAELKAFYRLMNHVSVTHEAVLAAATQRTADRAAQVEGIVLWVHDQTELDFTSRRTLPGLGQIGNGGGRGYLCHNTLVVEAATGDVLGLGYQKLAKRPKLDPRLKVARKKESPSTRRAKPDRESRLWKTASASLPHGVRRYVEVADRGGDLLEFLDHVDASGRSYLVRARHSRWIETAQGDRVKLFDFAQGLPQKGRRTVEVRATAGKPARTATVAVSWGRLTILMPHYARGEYRGTPLTAWVVRVAEIDPPTDAEPLEWILLTNVEVNNLKAACERIDWYELRWIIEDYHKAQKTGCGIENLQFTTEAALQPTIALLSVVAVTLLQLRSAARNERTLAQPATRFVPREYIVALSLWRYHEVRMTLTVRDFYYNLARLGGHQNRKSDGPPGWITLWRGWTKLQERVETLIQIEAARCG